MQDNTIEDNTKKDNAKKDNTKKGNPKKEWNYFLGWRHFMQGQNNIDADASANCDQGILRRYLKER